MLGYKERVFKLHTAISIEDLVPKNNIYRGLDQHLDLSFVRDLVSRFYSPMGRPSIDPRYNQKLGIWPEERSGVFSSVTKRTGQKPKGEYTVWISVP